MSGDFEGLIELGGAAVVEAAVMAGQKRTHCPNCGAEFAGPYCARCGQERDTHRRTIAKLLHDFFEDILSFDSRILRTARALVSQPGELTCAFREGRTQRYVPPIRLYFFVTLLFFLILSLSGIALLRLELVANPLTRAEIAKIDAQVKAAEDKTNAQLAQNGQKTIKFQIGTHTALSGARAYPAFRTHFFAPIDTAPHPVTPAVRRGLNLMAANFAKAKKALEAKGEKSGSMVWMLNHAMVAANTLARDPTAINGPLTTWIPRALFLLLPLFALLLALFHWRQRKEYFFVDHLVFSLNVHSFAFVVLIASVWLAQDVTGGIVGWLALATVSLYLLVAMRRVYRQSWFWTAMKFAFVSFIYASFFLLPALGIVIAVSAFEA